MGQRLRAGGGGKQRTCPASTSQGPVGTRWSRKTSGFARVDQRGDFTTPTAVSSSQTRASSSALYFSKHCFSNQIYIFKNPSDNHKPKKLPLL